MLSNVKHYNIAAGKNFTLLKWGNTYQIGKYKFRKKLFKVLITSLKNIYIMEGTFIPTAKNERYFLTCIFQGFHAFC